MRLPASLLVFNLKIGIRSVTQARRGAASCNRSPDADRRLLLSCEQAWPELKQSEVGRR